MPHAIRGRIAVTPAAVPGEVAPGATWVALAISDCGAAAPDDRRGTAQFASRTRVGGLQATKAGRVASTLQGRLIGPSVERPAA